MPATNPASNSENRNLRAISNNEVEIKVNRWQKLFRRQWPTLLPMTIAILGIFLATQMNFRVGVLDFSFGVTVAAVLRASLPRFSLGWLYVRTKWIDVTVLTFFSVFLIILSIVVPS
jgi:hypothetical protein